MDAATVFKLLSLIPDRLAAAPSGSACVPANAAGCKHPERLEFILARQHWMSPLEAIAKEDQRMLGLHAAHGRPVPEAGEEGAAPEEADLELEEEEFAPSLAEEEPASHAAL
jgi:hypothetical protein